MKVNKLDRFETKTESEISPEQDKQNREIIVNLLAPIIEKTQNLPSVPVSASFADLMNELKNGVFRQPTLIISGGSSEVPKKSTLHNSGDSEKKGSEIVTKFSSEELELLRKIENGEH
jgi:hypothetical protein